MTAYDDDSIGRRSHVSDAGAGQRTDLDAYSQLFHSTMTTIYLIPIGYKYDTTGSVAGRADRIRRVLSGRSFSLVDGGTQTAIMV